MEAVVIGALLNTFVPKLWLVLQNSHTLRVEVEGGIDSIKSELGFVLARIREPEWQRRSTSPKVSQVIGRARELAQETEYYICRFTYQTHARARTRLKNSDFAKKIEDLKEELKKIIPKLDSLASEVTTSAKEPQDPQFGEPNPVVFGMGVPSQDLLELLGRTPPESKTKWKLKVISIVGFGGSGKTRLAKQVYEMAATLQFRRQAWVHMGLERNVNEVLGEILKEVSASTSTGVQQVDNGDGASTGVQQVNNGAGASTGVTDGLKSYLGPQRYLIVIDDVRSTDDWDTLMKALPDCNFGSRIIVTTTSQQVAEYCSVHSGHVYKMSTLCVEDSQELFWHSLTNDEYSDVQKEQLQTVIDVCDGIPLALIESAKSLKAKMVEKAACQEAVHMVCAPEERGNVTLRRMQWVLMNKYGGLTSYGARACLLYFHMFPVDNPIKRKSLIRRLLAEELVAVEKGDDLKISDLDAASKYLKTLVDGNIIRPMQVSSNATIKSSILPRTMYEFISRKSISENFVAFSDYHVTPVKPEHIRRLSLHGGPSQYSTCIIHVELYLLRTLAVSGEACQRIMDFSQYKILRVLDLKGCDSRLDEKSLEAIWKLIMLKYLGLPGSIARVPRQIADLVQLETLDVEGAEVVEVYGEVIQHPKLKHLLGKFRLSASETYKKWVPKKSELEAFSGFVTNEDAVLPKLMKHMNELRKVKMWCECDSKAKVKKLNEVSTAIQGFILQGSTQLGDRSLSIDVTGCEVPFLDSLEAPGKLSKLKLHGRLEKVPEFIIPREIIHTSTITRREFITPLKVTSLCLSLTALCGSHSLFPFEQQPGATLLPSLRYLKLVEHDLGPLKILPKHFPSLERICLVGQNSLKDITINAGALQHLVSLHVICEHLVGLAMIKIGGLEKLKEITLHSKVSQITLPGKKSTKDIWKDAAKDHPNKPQVLFIEAAPKP